VSPDTEDVLMSSQGAGEIVRKGVKMGHEGHERNAYVGTDVEIGNPNDE